MKMQEVITKLREEAPLLERCSRNVDEVFQRMCGLLDDFRTAKSDEGRKVLADAIGDEMNVFGAEYRTLQGLIETVCTVNAEYKEKLGPRTKKPKDDPRQMDLFAAQSTSDATSVASRKCPRCKASALDCEFFDDGTCRGVVYPTNSPQYDPCVFCVTVNGK